MKSFHQWMECQQYYSHLKNLIKIKQGPSKIKEKVQRNKQLSKSICVHRRPFSISSLARKNRKFHPIFIKNQVREEIISKQNIILAERLLNTESVISKREQVASYQKLRSIMKKAPSRKKQQNYKQKRLKSFIRIHDEGINSQFIKITFVQVPQNQQKSSKLFWFKLQLQNQEVQSHYLQASQILLQRIIFPVKSTAVGGKGTLKIYYYRGLNYVDIGTYKIQIPEKGKRMELNPESIHDANNKIKIIISTEKLANKKNGLKALR